METTVTPVGSIVIGVDGSTSGAQALDWAIDQARLERRPLTLVHGVGPGNSLWLDQPGLDHRVALDAVREDARAVIVAARARVAERAPEVVVHEELRLSDPRAVLIELSQDASTVVVGSRGRGPLKSLLLGSVGVALTRHAHCPVVVVRPHNRGVVRRGVLVGADGTEQSLPTLEFAYRQASLHGLPLTVLHCFWDVRSAAAGAALVQPSEPYLEEERLLLAESVSGMAEKFPDVHVVTQLARGLAEDCLVRAADTMDLVVVGSHRHHPVAGLIYGSVASTVVEHASCVVAVVPEGRD